MDGLWVRCSGVIDVHVCCAVCWCVLLLQENDAASLARVKKDAKLLPALVYAMEEWERKLVSTGKCSATTDLSRITGRPAGSLARACLLV